MKKGYFFRLEKIAYTLSTIRYYFFIKRATNMLSAISVYPSK